MSALIASDLDRTLIYSQRFFTDTRSPRLCVEVYNGEQISFMTPSAAAGLRRLAAVGHVVPATTRTVEQYRRIDLPGGPFQYAVTSNGGTILVAGAPDLAWQSSVRARIRDGGAALDYVLAELRRRIDERWVRHLRVAENLFCYLVVEEAATPPAFLRDWTLWCEARGWRVSQQGRKIYAVPRTLCKSHAVAEVRRRLIDRGYLATDAPILAAGDGALDAEMLSRADAAIRPAHGELHALKWSRAGLRITDEAGAAAAEEIVGWFAEQSARGTSGTPLLLNYSRDGETPGEE